MARAVIPVQELDNRNEFAAAALNTAMFTAVDAADGAEFAMRARDDKILMIVQNGATSAKDVTVHHGDGIQGVCDLTVSVAASSYTFVNLDSGRFKVMNGADKGKCLITGGSADIKVAVFKLP
jgi:hypothetical protein